MFFKYLPKFLKFCLANKKLEDFLTHKNCQSNLLITEINLKKSRLRVLKMNFFFSVECLEIVLNCTDFDHVCSLFLCSNDVILKPHYSFQKKEFNVPFKNRQPKHNPDGFNFDNSKISLSNAEKSLLVKGLRFSLPPKKFNYVDYLTNFESFYRTI